MNTTRTRRGLTQNKRGSQALPNNAPNKGHLAAFTLIELLIVVLIIGILAAVAVPQYQKAVDKARVSELFALVKNLKVQQEVFFLQNGYYAKDCEELGADLPGGFEQTEDGNYGSKQYLLDKGPFEIILGCANRQNNKSDFSRVFGKLREKNDSLSVNIEQYFNHLTNDSQAGKENRAFCSAVNKDARSLAVCKSLGKEVLTQGKSYWL